MCPVVSLLESLAQHNKKPLFVLGKVFCAIIIDGSAKRVRNTVFVWKKKVILWQTIPYVKVQFWDVYEFSTDQI